MVEVAQQALAEKGTFYANLQDDKRGAVADILRLGTSAGGQRAKAIIAYNKTTGEVRSGQVDAPEGFENYLIKLDGVSGVSNQKSTDNYGRLEYSFARSAKMCGITITDCELIEDGERAHFLTKRFDRRGNEKIHMQTLCGVAHFDYRLLHGYSYEQAFDIMRVLRLSYLEAEEMFHRMVFNVVVRNQDDHTKNISFLMDRQGRWSLSPAYDIGYAYNPEGAWTAMHQMSINGKFSDITRNDLLECAARNNIRNAQYIIDEVCDTVSTWPSIARDCGVRQNIIDVITKEMQLSL